METKAKEKMPARTIQVPKREIPSSWLNGEFQENPPESIFRITIEPTPIEIIREKNQLIVKNIQAKDLTSYFLVNQCGLDPEKYYTMTVFKDEVPVHIEIKPCSTPPPQNNQPIQNEPLISS